MAKIFRQMHVEDVIYAASTKKTRELPLTVYRGLEMRLSFVHTNAAAASLTARDICDMITNMEIVINGQDTLMSLSGYDLYVMNYYDFAQLPDQSIDESEGADRTSYVHLYLPFGLTRAVNPEDTLLDVRGASTVNLEITFASSMGTGVTISSGKIELLTAEYDNVDAGLKVARHEIVRNVHSLTATGVRQEKLAVQSNNQYRRIFLHTKAADGTSSDAIITRFGLRARTYYWKNVQASFVKSANRANYGITPLTGVYIIDLTTDGKMVQRIDASKLPELIMELTSASATGEIDVVAEKAIYN